MVSNAQATTKGAIILLTNFVFISVIFPFVVLAFLDFSSLRSHFWPFTQVLRKIWPGVTRKVGKTEDVTDGISWLASAAADALQLDARLGALGPATAGRPTCFLSALSLQSLVNPILAQD